MKRIVIIDGQGGGIGRQLVEKAKRELPACEVIVIGTNAIATSAMMRAGADAGATGENAVVVACRDADVILGPIGIVVKDSMLGEVTGKMAAAIGESRAEHILIPVSRCRTHIAGWQDQPMAQLIDSAIECAREIAER